MLKSWRTWVLIALFLGPYLVYIGLGFLWLLERGWLLATLAGLAGFACGVVFAILAAKWTKTARELLPPIDWSSPGTFAPIDRDAWGLVQAEAVRGESIEMDALSGADLYIDTGRKLAATLAKHYHPLSADPLDKVPVLELLTALELAAEDLTGLCRQVPGGDLITPGHYKTAVQAANYLTRANNLYSYLLPLINPLSGLPRLASQHLMVRPAWKTMQHNLLRWFYQAYVNRLGMHLIELYSGRLVIGAEQYRRLTRKMIGKAATAPSVAAADAEPPVIAVVGARGAGQDGLVAAVKAARGDGADHAVALARLKGGKVDPETLARLVAAEWVAIPGYTAKPDRETARDRATRKAAVEAAVEADLLLVLVDDHAGTLAADAAFAADWDRWFLAHPNLERPPALVAIVTADRTRVDAARAVLPPTLTEVVAIDPVGASAGLVVVPGAGPAEDGTGIGLAEAVLPSVAALLPKAERAAILRQIHEFSVRSKAGRLLRQVSTQGKSLWGQFRKARSTRKASSTPIASHEPETDPVGRP